MRSHYFGTWTSSNAGPGTVISSPMYINRINNSSEKEREREKAQITLHYTFWFLKHFLCFVSNYIYSSPTKRAHGANKKVLKKTKVFRDQQKVYDG